MTVWRVIRLIVNLVLEIVFLCKIKINEKNQIVILDFAAHVDKKGLSASSLRYHIFAEKKISHEEYIFRHLHKLRGLVDHKLVQVPQ